MSGNNTIAKNAAYLTVAFLLQKIIALLYVFYVAKLIGPELFGQYGFALAFTTVWGIVVDFGLGPALIREVARAKELTGRYLGHVIIVKALLSLAVYAMVMVSIGLSGKDLFVQGLVALAGVVMVLDSFSVTLWGVFRAHQLMHYEAVTIVGVKILISTIGVGGLLAGFGLPALMCALIAGSVTSVLTSLYFLIKRLNVKPNFTIDRPFLMSLLRIAFPFAVASGFAAAYSQTGTIMVSFLGGDERTGWYVLASKIIDSLNQVVPAALATAIFPAMSALYLTSRERLRETFSKAFTYLIITAVPIALGTALLAKPIIVRIWGHAWSSSSVPLQILSVGLIFLFLNYPVGYLLNASNRQVRNTVHMGIATCVNVIANVILVPRFTFIGAAISSALSSVLLFALGFIVARRIIALQVHTLFIPFARAFFAGATMAVLIVLIQDRVSLAIAIPASAITYGAALFLVGGVPFDDLARVSRLLARRSSS